MTTYGTMIDRIADELNRTDLDTQIRTAIQSAVAHYEGERFEWTQTRSVTFSLTSSQEFYTAASYTDLGNLADIDVVMVTLNNNRYPVTHRRWNELEEISSGTQYTGVPHDFAYWIDQMRFYPIPNQGMPVRVTGTIRQTTLSATGDSNAWVDPYKGEEMIRARAKWDLFINVLRSDDGTEANRMKGLEMDAYKRNLARTASREATGKARPTQF